MARKTAVWMEWKDKGWVPRVARKHREEIFRSLASSIDSIRESAKNDYIIPNNTGTRHPYWSRKKQPSNPTRLTSRTGNLVKMLGNKGSWTFSAKQAKFHSTAFNGTIRITGGELTPTEQYMATLRVDINDASLLSTKVNRQMIQYTRKGHVPYGEPSTITIRETKQTLAIRFKHETGIRGSRRPFMTPAAQRENFNIHALVQARINKYTKTV